jgi:uncharacterized protein (TIGR00730 family)
MLRRGDRAASFSRSELSYPCRSSRNLQALRKTRYSHPATGFVTIQPDLKTRTEDETAVPNNALRRICIFCGSSIGRDPAYAKAAHQTGRLLAERGIALVYGGGGTGMMGAVADGCLEAGGQVVGVIPHALRTKELAHAGVTEMIVVESMHERKARMADLADAFVALPGGLGTLEEICEIATWLQLGIHRKPCGILNVAGYYDALIAFLDHAVNMQFLRREYREPLIVEREPAAMLARMSTWTPPETMRWVTSSES